MALVLLDNAEAKFVADTIAANPDATEIGVEWLPNTNRVSVVIDGECHTLDPDEAECEHANWFKDEDREGRRIRICEDCADVIYESEVQRRCPA